MAIEKAGQLVDYVKAAVQQHGAAPWTDIYVRIGQTGPVYRIEDMKGFQDQRGFCLILQTGILPTGII